MSRFLVVQFPFLELNQPTRSWCYTYSYPSGHKYLVKCPQKCVLLASVCFIWSMIPKPWNLPFKKRQKHFGAIAIFNPLTFTLRQHSKAGLIIEQTSPQSEIKSFYYARCKICENRTSDELWPSVMLHIPHTLCFAEPWTEPHTQERAVCRKSVN